LDEGKAVHCRNWSVAAGDWVGPLGSWSAVPAGEGDPLQFNVVTVYAGQSRWTLAL
jgi:hypothetical protein